MVNAAVITVVAVFAALGFFIYVITIFNGLIRLKVNIDKAWANIDVLLKQRHDEVPNLILVVEGYKGFEQQVLAELTRARSASMGAVTVPEKAQTNQALGTALNKLFAVAENYPSLKAQENFLTLQKRLSELEGEIADRRSFYNDSVANYNTRIAEFPDVLMAGLMGLARRDLFKVSEGDRQEIQVGFAAS